LPGVQTLSDGIPVKQLRWHSVTGGIAAVVVLTALPVLIILYARAGALHGSKFRLFAAAPDANNLRRGSEVWLDGQRVGTVRAIEFNLPAAPIAVRVVIAMDVLSAVRPRIRLDSRAELRNGGSVIGEPVVYIGSGTATKRQAVPGDTLRAAGNPDLEIAASRVASSMEQLPMLLANTRQIIANATTAGTRVSAILASEEGSESHGGRSLSSNASALMSTVTGGRGTAGRFLRGSDLRSQAARSMASMDSVRQLLASRGGELGRFRRDSSLAPQVRNLRREVAQLREMANSTGGAIGRAAADSALRRGLDSAFLELGALLADIKNHPLKYSRVF
jgi:phospholipid/cholesterol/gamma-HCH transport system substrate-binding protein